MECVLNRTLSAISLQCELVWYGSSPMGCYGAGDFRVKGSGSGRRMEGLVLCGGPEQTSGVKISEALVKLLRNMN
ncbi:BDN_1c_G0031240.mRNA.1.CDS.1 [Saccharomyces cerevisiae]|nr:BDN_1c_G0031240.mRNA.1.CDS.1 [Saccharomyces cerevisiae]CAI7298321.1 BDN_1c_G0031240.mRNA.1.CDS.1 [Saccharomyces cerevisiae]